MKLPVCMYILTYLGTYLDKCICKQVNTYICIIMEGKASAPEDYVTVRTNSYWQVRVSSASSKYSFEVSMYII